MLLSYYSLEIGSLSRGKIILQKCLRLFQNIQIYFRMFQKLKLLPELLEFFLNILRDILSVVQNDPAPEFSRKF